jgi:hypothetical protein
MIRISNSQAAFEAVAATTAYVYVEAAILDRLRSSAARGDRGARIRPRRGLAETIVEILRDVRQLLEFVCKAAYGDQLYVALGFDLD